MNASQVQPASAPPARQAGTLYPWFVLLVLCLGTIVSYIDRQIINLLVEPIKVALGINDSEIGLLQGFSFVLFYAVLALPLARLADSGSRVRMIVLGIACWSLATFSCGLASSFAVLFTARMFVGVGEATLTPCTFSLIPDFFRRSQISIAVSIFTGAGFVGSGIAYIIGGRLIGYLEGLGTVHLPLLGTLAPWQMTFMCAALPGLAILLLMALVREPERRSAINTPEAGAEDAQLKAVLAYLWANPRLFTGLFVGITLLVAGSFAVNSWTPAYLMRVFGWSPDKVGAVFGTMVVIASAGGVFAGGWLASMLMRRGVASANLLVPLVGAVLAIPLVIAYPLMPTPTLSLVLLGPALFLSALPFGCGSAVLPMVAPNRMRAQIVALYMLMGNLVGFTLGPTSIGVLTDYVYRDPKLVGHSLATAPALFYLLGAILICWAIPRYREMIERSP